MRTSGHCFVCIICAKLSDIYRFNPRFNPIESCLKHRTCNIGKLHTPQHYWIEYLNKKIASFPHLNDKLRQLKSDNVISPVHEDKEIRK